MKVQGDASHPPQHAREPTARDFQEVLGDARRAPSAPVRPAPRPRVAVGPGQVGAPRALLAAAPSARGPGTPELLRQVRCGHDTEAHRLEDVRAEAGVRQEARGEERTRELLRLALQRELGPVAPAPAPAHARAVLPPGEDGEPGHASAPRSSRAGAAAPGQPPGEARAATAEALLALVERIEVFVRAQRPALALSLGQAFAERVELERTGPGEVAVRVVGPGAGLRQEDLARLREAVEGRGLRLSRLVVAGWAAD